MRFSPLNYPYRVTNRQRGILSPGSRRKVAIVGFGCSTRPTAPLDDPSFEIWGLNHANRLRFMLDSEQRLRADRWFDLHEAHAQSEHDMMWIDKCPVPIYLPSLFTENPMALRYPIEDVEAEFGESYWCSSFAYMLALAAFEGIRDIHLCGVDLDVGRERVVERANLEYWIGLLRGKGYRITLDADSMLLKHPARYGLEYTKEKDDVHELCGKLLAELTASTEIAESAHRYVKQMRERILNPGA